MTWSRYKTTQNFRSGFKVFETVRLTSAKENRTTMRVAFVFVLLSAFIVAISSEPAADDEVADQPVLPWYNTYSYYYTVCRQKCMKSCVEQGYWKGVCKQGACYCFGPMGPYGRTNGIPFY